MADDYKPTLRSLLPRGKAWNFDLESNFLKLVFSFAVEMARVSNRALELITQVDPRTTTELLSDWERVLGLPDTCQGVLPASIEERRQDVISRLIMIGGQSLSYFKSLAQKRGFNVEFVDGYISRSGQLRSGQRVQGIPEWAFTIRMDVDEGSGVQYFQAGISGAGEPLDSFDVSRIECLINQIKPAHVFLFTAFQNTYARSGTARSGDRIRQIF